MLKSTLALICITVVSGCASIFVPNYDYSPSNVSTLKALKLNNYVDVKSFVEEEKSRYSYLCREIGTIEPNPGKSFGSYIQEAFMLELNEAGLYSNSSENSISAVINNLEFSDSISTSKWIFDITFNSSNGSKVNLKHQYEFEGRFLGGSACWGIAKSFPDAVQSLFGRLYQEPNFSALINNG